MKYSILLFDADNTVLDFDSAEEQALRVSFERHNLHFDHNVLQLYRKNNIAQWQRYERGETTRDEVLVNRFAETFKQLGIYTDVEAIADLYEKELHFGYQVVPHAEEILSTLQKTCKLYIVSNGVLSIQNSRMQGSGLDKYFIKRFISEDIGCPKPQREFFDRSFKQIENFEPSQALVIGDSLTSDIQGGVNAGVDTCWFNPKGLANNTKIVPTYEIKDLTELYNLVK